MSDQIKVERDALVDLKSRFRRIQNVSRDAFPRIEHAISETGGMLAEAVSAWQREVARREQVLGQ